MELFSTMVYNLQERRQIKVSLLAGVTEKKQHITASEFSYSDVRDVEREQEKLVNEIYEIDENIAFYEWAQDKGKELVEDGW